MRQPQHFMVGSTLSLFSRALLLAVSVAAFATASPADWRLVAPSPPGSGWDQLAQTRKELAAGLPDLEAVDIVNVPGTGGTVGLARFLAEPGRDLLVTGLTMLDATLLQRTPVTLDRMTPVARLAVEPFALVIPADSTLSSLDELKAAMWQDPAKVTWAGGPTGSIDHVAAALFARAVGVDPIRLNYVPFLATADAVSAVADGKVTCAIVSAGETDGEAQAGRIRVLGLTVSPGEPDGRAPALTASGIPLELTNWRGLVARPDLPPASLEQLVGALKRVTALPAWRAWLDRKGWRPGLLGPDEFGAFIRVEQARVKDALKATGALKRQD